MANNYTTTSLEALKYICSVINKTVDLPNTVISDASIATNTTYSSFKLDKEFTTLEDELKHYTDTAIAGLNKLTKEIINDKALVVKDNVLYLYKADDNPSNDYMQMMMINGVAVELGSTQVDMSDYYSKTDSDNKFAAKLDLDTLTTSFNDLKTVIGDTSLLKNATLVEDVKEASNKSVLTTLTSAQYQQLVTNGSVTLEDGTTVNYSTEDYYLVKDDSDSVNITSTISSTSTNSEVPTALAVEKRVKNMLVCPNDKSPKEFALENCKNGQVVEFVQWGGSHSDSVSAYATYRMIRGTDSNWGVLVATIYDTDHRRIIKYCPYDGYRDDANKWKSWQRVVTTKVDDVPWTKATLETNVTGTINFKVLNGVCYICFAGVSSATMSTKDLLLTTGLPAAQYSGIWHTVSSNDTTGTSMLVGVSDNGELVHHFGVDNMPYYGSFSYPVKES